MQKKVFIKTFGCQMNEYDSDKMADVLNAAEGLVKTDRPEEADVILLNTCSIREKAQEKVFSDLGRLRALKKENPTCSSAWAAAWPRRKATPSSSARPSWTWCSARRPCTACRR
jgi:tRNA-2-methylthio-N6-dimethylallyladenosine synthase